MPKLRIKCDQCAALMINGIFCHETGCPNMHSRYDESSDAWIKQYECFICGCECDINDPCCNVEPEFEEDENLLEK